MTGWFGGPLESHHELSSYFKKYRIRGENTLLLGYVRQSGPNNNKDGANMVEHHVKWSVGSLMANISGVGGMRYKGAGGPSGKSYSLFVKRLQR